MNPNPVLKRLGFSDTDRVVIIHTDDIGMCQASLTAFARPVGEGHRLLRVGDDALPMGIGRSRVLPIPS